MSTWARIVICMHKLQVRGTVAQLHTCALCIYAYIVFHHIFHIHYYKILSRVPCATQLGPYVLSILYTVLHVF